MPASVLVVTSEAVPLVKTGGLADVITALAATLRQQGIDATVMMPGYPAATSRAVGLRQVASLPDLPGGPGRLLLGTMPPDEAGVSDTLSAASPTVDGSASATVPGPGRAPVSHQSGVPVLLLDTAAFAARVGNPYVDVHGNEYGDNAACFAALAHAAVEVCAGRGGIPKPDVVHANDWHAGLVPALLKARGIDDVGSVLTIHNLAFQGNFPLHMAAGLGIPASMLGADGIEYWGQVSYLKAGIQYADRITTVSRSYAQEILTERFGHGMHGVLGAHRDVLSAIENGVDTDLWNPAGDPLIAQMFSSADMTGKAVNKRDLQKLFNLPQDDSAQILALGSRITHQKMADLALQALPQLLERHPRLQVMVLGRGDHHYEAGFEDLRARYPERVALFVGYDERHAHALHAGADVLLHGSRFEPFGLTPIYSMRYGTIPVGSRVGGLIDTIVDAGEGETVAAGANGFLFSGEQSDDMVACVDRALGLMADKKRWRTLQHNAMNADYAWTRPAQEYIRVYGEAATPRSRPAFARALGAVGTAVAFSADGRKIAASGATETMASPAKGTAGGAVVKGSIGAGVANAVSTTRKKIGPSPVLRPVRIRHA